MQNRYFGDQGDFSKFGLMRILGRCTRKMGLLWFLRGDETHNDDGKHVGYLANDNGYRKCDPQLYDALRKHLLNEQGEVLPSRRAIRFTSELEILPESTVFIDTPVDALEISPSGRRKFREAWFQEALGGLKECDMVFCDADNGLEVYSVPKPNPKASKYVYWDEVEALWRAGHSLVIYQHRHRKQLEEQLSELLTEFEERLDNPTVFPLLYRRGSNRFYLVVPQPELEECCKRTVDELLASSWGEHFELM